MSPLLRLRCLILVCVSLLPAWTLAEVKPALRVLRDQCLGCHKPGKAKGGLLLTSREKMIQGGDSGAPVILGKPDESLLYQLCLEDGDPHMPPKKQLKAGDLAALKSWIQAGAAWDASVFDESPAPKKVTLNALPASYQPVLALALSPDDSRLAVARANTVFLIDLKQPNRTVIGQLEGQLEAITALGWSPDGQWLISGGFQRLTMWEAASLKQARQVTESLVGNLTALAADRQSQTIFIADGETGGAGFIRQFELPSGKLLRSWKAHDDNVLALAVSHQGDRLLSGGADRLAKLWDIPALKLVSTYEGHTNHVLSLAFNADGSQIATASADREIKLWNTQSTEQETSLGDKKHAFAGLAWSPDGKTLVAVTDKGAGSLYSDFVRHTGGERSERAKEKKLPSLGAAPTSLVITRDSRWIYSGDFDGRVHVWDVAAGKLAEPLAFKAPPPSAPARD